MKEYVPIKVFVGICLIPMVYDPVPARAVISKTDPALTVVK